VFLRRLIELLRGNQITEFVERRDAGQWSLVLINGALRSHYSSA